VGSNLVKTPLKKLIGLVTSEPVIVPPGPRSAISFYMSMGPSQFRANWRGFVPARLVTASSDTVFERELTSRASS